MDARVAHTPAKAVAHAFALFALTACGHEAVEAPPTAPAAEPSSATQPVDAPDSAPAMEPATEPATEPADAPPPAGRSRIEISLGGNTIGPAGGMSQPDGWSLVELTLADGGPLRVDVRLAPDLGADPSAVWAELMAEANRGGGAAEVAVVEMDTDQLRVRAKLPRATLTLAGRAFDLSGGRLSIGGVDLGAVADGAQVELSATGVGVGGERRGDLPD